jgi:hypothetical protein
MWTCLSLQRKSYLFEILVKGLNLFILTIDLTNPQPDTRVNILKDLPNFTQTKQHEIKFIRNR